MRSFVLLCLAAAGCSCDCREPAAPGGAASQPADNAVTQPTTDPATQPAATQPVDPAAPVRVQVKTAEEPQKGWLRIEKLYENVPGGWASAHRPTPHRIVIESEDVHQFSFDTSQLEIDWSNRVWVRINRYAFELKHKRHPVVHLRESRAGAWEVVEVHDD